MSYGDRQWRSWVLDEQAAMPFFRKAIEAGINFFDMADMYSVGVSEEITGKALRQYAKPEQVVIATKVFNSMGEGPNMAGLSRKHIQQGCEASLRRLGVRPFDLYQIHRVDAHTPVDETLSAQTVWFTKARSATLEPVPWLRGSSPRLFRFPRGMAGHGSSACKITTT